MLTLSSNSTSVNNGRTKYFTCELKRPEQSLQDRMDRAIYGKQDHPNLSMVLGTTQRIRMEVTKKYFIVLWYACYANVSHCCCLCLVQ